MTTIPCRLGVVTEPRYAEGGLAQAAQSVADAGREGDSVVVHLAPAEFQWLRQNWGEPTINPQTGMPEYFKVADLFRAAAPFVPIVANTFFPGAASAVGSLFAGPQWAPAVGSTLIGAGAGALGGGLQGALGGALAGAGAAAIDPALRQALAGGSLGGMLGITPPAVAAGAGNQPAGAAGASSGGTGSPPGGGASPAGGKGSSLLPLLLGGGALLAGSQMMSRPRQQSPSPPPGFGAQSSFRPVNYNLGSRSVVKDVDWYRFGERPRTDALDPLFMERTMTVAKADGGAISAGPLSMLAAGGARAQGAVAGPGTGRSDEIPARLSDGEYVIDAETVALLGDGSSDAGAKRLDEFRHNIRAHKGGALSRGKISPNAKPPENYLTRRS